MQNKTHCTMTPNFEKGISYYAKSAIKLKLYKI